MLGECLCVCDNICSSFDDLRIVIWVMKDYGMKESWSKEIVIPDPLGYLNGMVHPLKVFKDGTLIISYIMLLKTKLSTNLTRVLAVRGGAYPVRWFLSQVLLGSRVSC